jgi:AraC-like DNA-binding protein
MSNRFRVSSSLLRRIEAVGIAPETVLRQAGLRPDAFQQEKLSISTEEFFALYRALAEASSAPGLGLRLGSEERVERYDPIALAAIACRTFRDALQRMSRYKQLTCPEKITLVKHGDECAVQFIWLLAQEAEPELLVDVCFAWVVAISRRGTGRAIAPKRVEFQRSAAHRQVYEAHFHCSVKFQAEQNALIFHDADLEQPFLTYNPDLFAMVAPQLEAELAEQSAQKTLGEQVKSIVKRMLAGQRPGLRDVARELRLSTRTLQRRLTGTETSFQQLMEEARRELARHYLLNSSLELNETAYLLGFEDANSFFRAFHQWEGTSPGEWRTLQRVNQAPLANSRAAASHPAGL